MPNWVTNIVTVTGSNIKDFKEKFFTFCDDDNTTEKVKCFDFNKIVPMNEDLNIERGSYSIQHLSDERINKLFYNFYSPTHTQETYVKTVIEQLKLNRLLSNNNGEKTEQSMDRLINCAKGYFNQIRYGYSDWYDFCYKEWGTKWNACDTVKEEETADKFVFSFSTAWATPLPIYEKLAELGYNFSVAYADEDIGYNLGIIKSDDNGELICKCNNDIDEEINRYVLAICIRYYGCTFEDIKATLTDYEIDFTEQEVKEAVKYLTECIETDVKKLLTRIQEGE